MQFHALCLAQVYKVNHTRALRRTGRDCTRLTMDRLLGGKGTVPPGTPLVARHGAALATMALNMKQTEDPPSVSEILERRLQAQAEAVHNRLAFVKQLDMGMGIEHRNPELIRMLPDPATASATKKGFWSAHEATVLPRAT